MMHSSLLTAPCWTTSPPTTTTTKQELHLHLSPTTTTLQSTPLISYTISYPRRNHHHTEIRWRDRKRGIGARGWWNGQGKGSGRGGVHRVVMRQRVRVYGWKHGGIGRGMGVGVVGGGEAEKTTEKQRRRTVCRFAGDTRFIRNKIS